MPKIRGDRSTSYDRSKDSHLPYNSRHSKTTLPKDPLEDEENSKEWEEARCSVCMEHPHNAILLICTSHGNGCHPFMCDTSYRHSNCFDQFQKSIKEASSSTTLDRVASREDGGSTTSIQVDSCEDKSKPKLICPLCRGEVNGWIVVESARKFMNAIPRSCACETCDYSGSYTDLRKHARNVHPLVRPNDADPERQRDWRRLERQRDVGDLLSTLQTSFQEETSEEDISSTFDEGSWLTVFLLVRILRPGSSSRRAQVTIRRRPSRRLWGETYDWEADSRENNNEE